MMTPDPDACCPWPKSLITVTTAGPTLAAACSTAVLGSGALAPTARADGCAANVLTTVAAAVGVAVAAWVGAAVAAAVAAAVSAGGGQRGRRGRGGGGGGGGGWHLVSGGQDNDAAP